MQITQEPRMIKSNNQEVNSQQTSCISWRDLQGLTWLLEDY